MGRSEHEQKLARLREIGRRFREEEPDPAPDDDRIRGIENVYDDRTGLPR